MAKSSKTEKSERRQVIDDIRRKQKRADKRQGMAIVGVCVVVALVIIGAALYPKARDIVNDQKWKGKSVAEIGAGADVCGDITEKEATGSGEHVPEGQQVDYTDAPPAFGAHWNVAGVAPTPIGDRFYTADSRPELEALVHNLEHGYTILWYDKTAGDDSGELSAMRAIAKIMDANDTNQRLKFKVAPGPPPTSRRPASPSPRASTSPSPTGASTRTPRSSTAPGSTAPRSAAPP
ncbi:DUF3105 domain-containing protein [Nocardioides humi]|uniref:DUF3105 domain-containing protein n=1 Tax=Nocardioides humi TaxID=449461 RepID=UPI001FED206E|nr:DUF3105 domain-containing protein [Nocardioides humi]